jgi:predicted outer membrane repeat protein
MNASAYIRPSQHPLAAALLLGLGLTPLVGLAATISVTTTGDAGDAGTCTVRQAITSMNNAALTGTNCVNSGAAFGTSNTINFDTTTFPVGGANTISLADVVSGTLQVTALPLTIDASSNGGVTIQRPNSNINSFGIISAFNAPGGTLTLNSVTLKGGATGACGNNGGGICGWDNVNFTLVNSTLSGNSSELRGGGIYSRNSVVTLTNSTLSGNSSYQGGGIFSAFGAVIVTNSTLSSNSASEGSGGGIEKLSGSLSITGSTLSANSAKWGGGTDANASALTFVNSTFSGNSASGGGGAVNFTTGDTFSATNCTFSANTGGGVSPAIIPACS